MAKNDALLLDGILDDRVSERIPSDERSEAFEYFAFEQILRDADLSHEEIASGSVDGRDDGGIDGFYILVNGHPLCEIDSFMWPRSGCELEVWVITCKHHETFRQAPLDNLAASASELFDLSINNDQLNGSYSDQLLVRRTHLQFAYRKLSPRLQKFKVNFVYASRGDGTDLGDSVVARGRQIESIANELFGDCDANFSFCGARELLDTYRKVRSFSVELPFQEALTRGERYVLLCTLQDYYKFVADEDGKLRRYLFDSNVRSFMGLNRVNEDIRHTLATHDSPDFWCLNNGVTILATSASVTGKSIQLEGVQIVNGLQTTESVFRHFSDAGTDPEGRAVLVKIVVSNDAEVRDSIILATNNQTAVETQALHATDKIQRDIEDVLLQHGMFYERRTNFYKNQGRAVSETVSPLQIASGYITLILKSPAQGTAIKSRFMRNQESYRKVFSTETPLLVWPSIVTILRKTDGVLDKQRPLSRPGNSRFLKKWRQITAFVSVARLFGTFAFNAAQLSKFDHEHFDEQLIESSWNIIRNHLGQKGKTHSNEKNVIRVCRKFSEQFSIDAIQIVESNKIATRERKSRKALTEEFINRVDGALPAQPWPVRIHADVAKELSSRQNDVYDAIQHLVDSGRRNRQKDGIVYDEIGTVIAVDEKRVSQS